MQLVFRPLAYLDQGRLVAIAYSQFSEFSVPLSNTDGGHAMAESNLAMSSWEFGEGVNPIVGARRMNSGPERPIRFHCAGA
jgi:hypothetical protein